MSGYLKEIDPDKDGEDDFISLLPNTPILLGDLRSAQHFRTAHRIVKGRTTHILLGKWDTFIAYDGKATVSMKLHVVAFVVVSLVMTAGLDIFFMIDRRLFS